MAQPCEVVCLENRQTFTGFVSSNLTLSAKYRGRPWIAIDPSLPLVTVCLQAALSGLLLDYCLARFL